MSYSVYALSSGSSIHHYETLGSTSSCAKEMLEARTPLDLPLWITTDRQTSGYGRRAKTWHHTLGNFAGTLIITPERDHGTLTAYSFIAALAVRDTIKDLIGAAHQHRVETKWPNDILIDAKKTAGLLLELHGNAGALKLMLGIGINIASHPDDTPYPATSLRAYHAKPDFHSVTERLDHYFHQWSGSWARSGFELIRSAWLENAAGLGKPIKVRLSDQEITGIFETIDDTGALILDKDGTLHTINTGDVFL